VPVALLWLCSLLEVAFAGPSPLEKQAASFNRLVRQSRARNLVVINAVGRLETIPAVLYNLQHHFADPAEWQCVAMLYAHEPAFRAAIEASVRARNSSGCAILSWRHALWGQTLHLIRPRIVRRFEHVALLLDDVVLPASGPLAVSVPRLLRQMRRFDMHVISPAVHGAHYHATRANLSALLEARDGAAEPPGEGACTRRVSLVEIFFAIHTRKAWACMASLFVHSNVGGCAYDLCFAARCAQAHAIGVDMRGTAVHLEGLSRAKPFTPTDWSNLRMLLPPPEYAYAVRTSAALRGQLTTTNHANKNVCVRRVFDPMLARHGCDWALRQSTMLNQTCERNATAGAPEAATPPQARRAARALAARAVAGRRSACRRPSPSQLAGASGGVRSPPGIHLPLGQAPAELRLQL
jgi:hypothetical protein